MIETSARSASYLAMAGIAVSLLGGCGFGSGPSDAEIIAGLKSDQVVAAFMTANPEVEEKILQAVDDADGSPSVSRQTRAALALKPIILAHMQYQLKHLDDAMTVKLAGVMSKVALQRASLNSPQCLPRLEPGQTFVDLLPPGEGRAFIAEIAGMKPDLNPRYASKQELGATLDGQLPNIAAHGGLTQEQVIMAYTNESAVEPSVTCRVMGGTLASLAALPASTGAPVVRTLIKL